MDTAQQRGDRFVVARQDTRVAHVLARVRRGGTAGPTVPSNWVDGVAGAATLAGLLGLAGLGMFGDTSWETGLLLEGVAVSLAVLAVAMATLTTQVHDPRLRQLLLLTAAHRDRARRFGEDVVAAELGFHHTRLCGLAEPLNRAWQRRAELVERLQSTQVPTSAVRDSTRFAPLVARHDDELAIQGIYDELAAEAAWVDATERTVARVQHATRKLVDAAKEALRVRERYATAVEEAAESPHTAEVADTEEALARVREHRDAVVAAIAELPD